MLVTDRDGGSLRSDKFAGSVGNNLTQGVPLPEAFGRQGLCQPTLPESWAKLRYTAERQRFAKRCSFYPALFRSPSNTITLAVARLFVETDASAGATQNISTRQRVTVNAEVFLAEVFFM